MQSATYKIRYAISEPRVTSHGRRAKSGFTLVEMLVVIAIVAILATMIVGVASRIEAREKEKHCRSTLALLTTALAQFHEHGFNYKGNFSGFTFPLDCNGFSTGDIQTTLEDALGVGTGNVQTINVNDPNYSSNEVMCLFLSMVPASRQTLGKINQKLVTNLNSSGQSMKITIVSGDTTKDYSVFRIIDPWEVALRYDYYDEQKPPITTAKLKTMKDSTRQFPLITSAGPDKKFGTGDDITSRD